MATVQMNAAGVGGTINFQNTGPVVVPANGLITIQTGDITDALRMGCTYVNSMCRWYTTPGPPRAASAGRIFASAGVSTGTLAVANQPDVPRQLAIVVWPGTVALTGGSVVLTYVANDGTTTVDSTTMAASASALTTFNTTKGVVSVTSIVTNTSTISGGASPAIQINDTNALAMAVDPGFVGFNVIKESTWLGLAVTGGPTNQTVGTVGSAAGCYTPTFTPSTTVMYGIGYVYTMPSS